MRHWLRRSYVDWIQKIVDLEADKETVDVVRKKLEETVKGNGGEYRGDLNKEVTHLIAHKPTGQKYVYAKSWGIHIISIEWLQQSLERGMILDEQLYDPLMEPTERGRDAWVRRTASIASLAKRARDDEVAPAPARKLRRTASARFSSQNQDIWTDIVGGGFGQEGSKRNEWDDQQDSLSTVKPDSDDRTPPEPVSLESDKASRATRPDSEGGLQLSRSTETETLKPQGLFYGKRFYLHGFDAKKVGSRATRGNILDLTVLNIDCYSSRSFTITQCRDLARYNAAIPGIYSSKK